jgi:hypothetical protein
VLRLRPSRGAWCEYLARGKPTGVIVVVVVPVRENSCQSLCAYVAVASSCSPRLILSSPCRCSPLLLSVSCSRACPCRCRSAPLWVGCDRALPCLATRPSAAALSLYCMRPARERTSAFELPRQHRYRHACAPPLSLPRNADGAPVIDISEPTCAAGNHSGQLATVTCHFHLPLRPCHGYVPREHPSACIARLASMRVTCTSILSRSTVYSSSSHLSGTERVARRHRHRHGLSRLSRVQGKNVNCRTDRLRKYMHV